MRKAADPVLDRALVRLVAGHRTHHRRAAKASLAALALAIADRMTGDPVAQAVVGRVRVDQALGQGRSEVRGIVHRRVAGHLAGRREVQGWDRAVLVVQA